MNSATGTCLLGFWRAAESDLRSPRVVAVALSLVLVVVGIVFVPACASSPSSPSSASPASAPPSSPSVSPGARGKTAPAAGPLAPYDAPPAAAHAIEINLQTRAAREILASLSRPKYDSTDVRVLEDMPAVKFAIHDSQRGADVFERDFAAAFDEQTKTSVFDFRSIREARDRWQILLDAILTRQADIVRLASVHAASLLPGDRPVSVRLDVFLSFGLAGLGDHIVLKGENGREAIVVDLSRAIGDSEGEPLDSRISRIARVIAGEAFREAWTEYRKGDPAWQHSDPQLGQLDVLLRAVAEAGPVALYSVDENFFPLSVWLKDPMRRAVEDLNRRADRFAEASENLEKRMDLTAEVKRGEFMGLVAGQDGAYLVDGIVQTAGLNALRSALQAGPRAFFEAYNRASASNKNLVPLSKSIRDRLAGVPAHAAPKHAASGDAKTSAGAGAGESVRE